MRKVIIDLEEEWQWWPRIVEGNELSGKIAVELSDEFLAEYHSVTTRYLAMQNYLEHCYRHQEGLSPLANSPFKEGK